MSPWFRFVVLPLAIVIALAILFLTGCNCDGGFRNMSDEWCEHQATQSWDQENLKRLDKGCPNAIYIAPKGVLQEC
jgi:hypothetical protein